MASARSDYSAESPSPPDPASAASPSPSRLSVALALADDLGLGFDLRLVLHLEAGRGDRGDRRFRVVNERYATRRGDRLERDRVVDLHLRDVVLDRVRNVGRERLDRQLARDLLEHAALLDARGVIDAGELEHDRRLDRLVEADAEQVDVHRVAADRMADELLEHDGRGRGTVDAQVEQRAGVRERIAKLPRVDRERDRILATAVDDAGDLTLPSQATRRPRSRGFTLRDIQGCRLGPCHWLEAMVASNAQSGWLGRFASCATTIERAHGRQRAR